MENDYSFKTTPFGYDKEAVLDALNRLNMSLRSPCRMSSMIRLGIDCATYGDRLALSLCIHASGSECVYGTTMGAVSLSFVVI